MFKLVILLEGACGANMDSIEHHRIRQEQDGLGHTLCGLDFFGHGINKSHRISFPQENVKIVERGRPGGCLVGGKGEKGAMSVKKMRGRAVRSGPLYRRRSKATRHEIWPGKWAGEKGGHQRPSLLTKPWPYHTPLKLPPVALPCFLETIWPLQKRHSCIIPFYFFCVYEHSNI